MTVVLLGMVFAPSPARSVVTPIELTSVAAPCQDVVFIGARGSGQDATASRGLGPQVDAALTEYTRRLSGRRVAYWPAIFPSQAVEVLATNVFAFFDGLDQGVSGVLDLLKNRATRCPSERYVLAGYSQGAMVAHRVLTRIGSVGITPARIDAAILIADGDRQSSRAEVSLGTAGAGGYGVTWVFRLLAQSFTSYDAATAKIPDSLKTRTYSICDRGDSVCDRSRIDISYGNSIHSTHYTGSADVFTAVARAAATTNSRAPVPAMRFTPESLSPATVGRPVQTFFSASGGKSPYRYSTSGALPPGLVLSGSGKLSGTPTQTGSYSFTIRLVDSNSQIVSRSFAMSIMAATPATHGAFVDLSVKDTSRCAVDSAGDVYCWGGDGNGQLGQGHYVEPISTPRRVPNLPEEVRQVSVGGANTCAVSATGAIYCWGLNMFGQMGSVPDNSTIVGPTKVPGLPGPASMVSTSVLNTCALMRDGSVTCWGSNEYGQLGSGSTIPSSTPISVVGLDSRATSVSVENGVACATTESGQLACWGANYGGNLGNGTHTSSPVPVPVAGLVGNVTAVETGGPTCASTDAGNLYCWGYEDPTGVDYQALVRSTVPVKVNSSQIANGSVSTARSSACVVNTVGGVSCWGSNYFGDLGNATGVGTTVMQSETSVSGLPNTVIEVSGAGQSAPCALLVGGSVYCWGLNWHGELGRGTIGSLDEVLLPGPVL